MVGVPSVASVKSLVKLELRHDSFRWSRIVKIAPASDGQVLESRCPGKPSVEVPSTESPRNEQRAESRTSPVPL